MKPRLGCLTLPAIITVVLGFLIFGGVTLVRGGVLFNPGSLNAQEGSQPLGGVFAHADMATKCAACHPAPWQSETMCDRCVACHTDVGQDPQNFHHAIVDGNVNCRRCHSDHNGVAASLTIMDPHQFPHEKVGYSLSGHHRTENGSAFTCADCHGEKTSSFDIGVCATCHNQIDAVYMEKHTAAFGLDCLACHDGLDVYGKFNHDKGAFPLSGKHAVTDCVGCHTGARKPTDLQFTPRDCFACHGKDDPHLGRMGQDCAACHSPKDWKLSLFDHSKVAFPLIGKHTSVSCQDCHLDERLQDTPQDCFSCHGQQDPHLGELGQDCASCHVPLDWKQIYFDHSHVIFPLLGRHIAVACQECHKNSLYKRTPQDCFDCHGEQDPHQGQLGNECVICHTPVDWTVVNFDHSKVVFPLTGKHISVACRDCHQDNLFKNTPQDCFSCHNKDDPHQGQLGQNCASCHTPEDWRNVTYDHSQSRFLLIGKHASVECSACHTDYLFKNTPMDCYRCHAKDDSHNGQLDKVCAECHTPVGWDQTTFDHSKASFQLSGKHISVNCAACHPGGRYIGTPKDCYSCHAKDDNHNGQLGTDCGACHSPSGWGNATFDHTKSGFPLTGKHTTVNCASCHVGGKYKGTPKDCYSCHANDDNHNGQLGTDCMACHTPAGWGDVKFDHSKSGFPLTGKHVGVNCASCHPGGQYRGTPKDCYSCHAQDDAHDGELGTNCSACHTTNGWQGATFDHSNTSFPLTGQHTSVSCKSCHVNGKYKGTPTDCFSCHAGDDAHGGQYGTDCKLCHNPNGWSPAHYDHSGFPLTGAHAGLTCTSCHPGGRFKGTPKACSACHDDPAYHAGLFGNVCDECHNTNAWRLAQYNRSHTFPMNHGGHNNCHTCHPNKLAQYTCYTCHDPNEIRNKHLEEGIPNYDNCMQCHPDGQKHDGLAVVGQQYAALFNWLTKLWGGNW